MRDTIGDLERRIANLRERIRRGDAARREIAEPFRQLSQLRAEERECRRRRHGKIKAHANAGSEG